MGAHAHCWCEAFQGVQEIDVLLTGSFFYLLQACACFMYSIVGIVIVIQFFFFLFCLRITEVTGFTSKFL